MYKYTMFSEYEGTIRKSAQALDSMVVLVVVLDGSIQMRLELEHLAKVILVERHKLMESLIVTAAEAAVLLQ